MRKNGPGFNRRRLPRTVRTSPAGLVANEPLRWKSKRFQCICVYHVSQVLEKSRINKLDLVESSMKGEKQGVGGFCRAVLPNPR